MSKAKDAASAGRGDKMLFGILALVLVAAAVGVSVQMFAPSNRKAVVDGLVQEGLGIISAAQAYANQATAADSTGRPFGNLRFDRIGYLDGLSGDGMTLTTETGRFSLQVAQGGRSFDLHAEGADGISVRWEKVTPDRTPDPVIQ